MAKKTRAQLEVENRYLRRRTGLEAIASVVNHAIRVGGAVAIAYFGYRTVGVLAGETTTANIGIRFLADVRVSDAVAWLFGAGGVMYGLRQRRLRRSTVERLSGRITQLEKGIDSRRTSSHLTPRGETQPEDEP